MSAFLCPVQGLAVASSSLSVDVKGTAVEIRADQVPLIEILKALSDKTGLLVETGDPLQNLVSLNLKQVSLEACLKRLLMRHNYSLTYTKTGDNRFVPVSISIIGSSLVKRLDPAPAPKRASIANPVPEVQPEPMAIADTPREDHMKMYEKSWFAQTIGETTGLAKQIEVEMAEADAENPPSMRIKNISPDSVLYNIGLRTDDRIHNVNGKPISTAKELIETLKASIDEAPMIRIDRTAQTGRMPIYIELH